MGLTLRLSGGAAATAPPAPGVPTAPYTSIFNQIVAGQVRTRIMSANALLAVNNSVFTDIAKGGSGATAGSFWLQNNTGGMSNAVEWNATILAMVHRMTVGVVPNAGGSHYAYHSGVPWVRMLVDPDPAFGPILRTRFGIVEVYGGVLLGVGVMAGAWSARVGLAMPRNTAGGVRCEGIVFYADETSPNWQTAIEIRGNPETTSLYTEVQDTGIPHAGPFWWGVRVGPATDATAAVDWIVNGAVIRSFVGVNATRFWNVGPTAPSIALMPIGSVTKALAGDPALPMYSLPPWDMYYWPPVTS